MPSPNNNLSSPRARSLHPPWRSGDLIKIPPEYKFGFEVIQDGKLTMFWFTNVTTRYLFSESLWARLRRIYLLGDGNWNGESDESCIDIPEEFRNSFIINFCCCGTEATVDLKEVKD